ncbi:hypothetical protein ILUMI_19969 [Ignelater luminosus]|uniref:Uncharacterized protein n=1 Tax=Ignelater luminosus TaxID=2038154 RepID=A0A8K0CH72_IGNLU|nr:hypothetical protein ILUMI_19969 [Ignelater luminosus]
MSEKQNTITKLRSTGDNWSIWKFQVKVLLQSKELYGYVTGEEKEPKKTDTDNWKKWKKKDYIAVKLIVSRIDEEIMNYSWDNSINVSMNIAKLEELKFKLNELGEPISEKLIITKILTSLPTEYGYFISAWESMPENKRTLDILTARLDNALIGKTCYVCGKKGHISRLCKDKKSTHNKNNKSQVDKTHIYCDYCKKPGHISKFCWYKKYKKNDKINKNAAFVGLDFSEMNSVLVDFNDDETWIADSGASEHISNQKKWFENYYEFDKPTEIKIGNGSVINAHGKGKISLIAFDGQDYIPTKLNDVVYVQDIKFNLFSIGAALDKGYTMMTDNKTCKIIKGNDVYAIGLRIDKLYHMQFRHAGLINVNLINHKIVTFINYVKNNLNFNVKTIRTDDGKEEVNSVVKEITEKEGITHQLSCAYTPEQNSRIEREMRTIVEAARTILHAKDLPNFLWAEAVNTAVYIINLTGNSSVDGKTPYELWYNKDIDLNKLRVFGEIVHVHIPKQKRLNWDSKSKKGLFVGYPECSKGYRVYFSSENKIDMVRDVIFGKEQNKDLGVKENNENTRKCVSLNYDNYEYQESEEEKEDQAFREKNIEFREEEKRQESEEEKRQESEEKEK